MTITIRNTARTAELRNAELMRDALLKSEPRLADEGITLEIFCDLQLPQRQLDLVLIYYDREARLHTSSDVPIHSFVLVVEVKRHSSDLIRFEGPRVNVRYDGSWTDASDQCSQQSYALKGYLEQAYWANNRRNSPYLQKAIWLARAHLHEFGTPPALGGVSVHFADLNWDDLTSRFHTNSYFKQVRTLVDGENDPTYHSLNSIRACLGYELRPTPVDLRRINALTQTRFDAEKTAYIRNLGTGLLTLSGRGGTGKTFSLVQIALHLAKQGKRTVILTYNHGLIADISRSLRLIKDQDPTLAIVPKLMTRYAFIKSHFVSAIGADAEKQANRIADLTQREQYRVEALLQLGEKVGTDYDFALVDEGQDWTTDQRDLMFKLFGAGNIVVADGVDQFVGQDRCSWDRGDIPINRRHRLRASRRTKSATCQTIGEVASELGLTDWDLEPDKDAHGGRFTVLVEPDPRRAVDRVRAILEADGHADGSLFPVDNLVCMPSPTMARGINYPAIFDVAVAKSNADSWRGFDERDRRVYPLRDAQLRAVQYHSCRGMEGWTTACLALDVFYAFQLQHPLIDKTAVAEAVRAEEGFLFSNQKLNDRIAKEAQQFATNWLMMPLTRSIDHLVVHLAEEQSKLGRLLRTVSSKNPGAVEWLLP